MAVSRTSDLVAGGPGGRIFGALRSLRQTLRFSLRGAACLFKSNAGCVAASDRNCGLRNRTWAHFRDSGKPFDSSRGEVCPQPKATPGSVAFWDRRCGRCRSEPVPRRARQRPSRLPAPLASPPISESPHTCSPVRKCQERSPVPQHLTNISATL